MSRNFILTAASVLALAAVTGCSSSSSNNSDSGAGNGADSSTGSDSGGGSDTGTTPTDDGGTGGGDTGTTPVVDSGTPPMDDSGPPAEAGPATCPAAFSAGDLQPFVPVNQVIGACTATQISGYLTACDSTTATQTTCTNFFNDAANANCLSCLDGAPVDAGTVTNTGARLFAGMAWTANTPGCIALADPDGGTACATAQNSRFQCELITCGQCTTQAEFTSCQNAVLATGGACATYTDATQCAADFADGGARSTSCGTTAAIFNKICGTGTP